jgi:hypothetical protein
VTVSKPDLEALVAKWKPILRLEDWDIEIEYARKYELADGCAECNANIMRNLCTIKILDPNDINPDEDANTRNVEATVVHELLHIHFRPYMPERNTLNYEMWERTIDMLSIIMQPLGKAPGKKSSKR